MPFLVELEADELDANSKLRRLKDHGHGYVTYKVQDHKIVDTEYFEKHRSRTQPE